MAGVSTGALHMHVSYAFVADSSHRVDVCQSRTTSCPVYPLCSCLVSVQDPEATAAAERKKAAEAKRKADAESNLTEQRRSSSLLMLPSLVFAEALVSQLTEMGFSVAHVKAGITAGNNNLTKLLNWLDSNPEPEEKTPKKPAESKSGASPKSGVGGVAGGAGAGGETKNTGSSGSGGEAKGGETKSGSGKPGKSPRTEAKLGDLGASPLPAGQSVTCVHGLCLCLQNLRCSKGNRQPNVSPSAVEIGGVTDKPLKCFSAVSCS